MLHLHKIGEGAAIELFDAEMYQRYQSIHRGKGTGSQNNLLKERTITMKTYIGAKIIQAEPMDECTFLTMIKGEDTRNRETRPGYKVVYPDGYISWSPEDVFENAYREVTPGEILLLQ